MIRRDTERHGQLTHGTSRHPSIHRYREHTYLTGLYPEKSAAYEPVKSYFKPIDVKLVFIYFFDYFEVIFQV